MNKDQIFNIVEQIKQGHQLTKIEALALVETSDKESLYEAANEVRKYFLGNYFDLCSIENAKSGACSEDCKWCSQSIHHHSKVDVYELVESSVAVKQAIKNESYGVKRYSLVTSGRAVSNKNLDQLCETYKTIRSSSEISFCASMGLLDKAKLEKLKNVGVEHYHCNLETSRRFFPELCSTHSYNEKIETIKTAQSIGMKICSGGIFGMGETMEDRIDMAIDLADLGVQSIPINFLNPIEGTPLQNSITLSKEEVLSSIAIVRLINPKANIRFAGGRNLLKSYQEEALRTGISAAVVGDLLTTTGSSGVEEDKVDFLKAGFHF
ncbi:MAG: biotin synthase BioB [Bacteroidales bacterium]|nr:biotin synthase BioB [Bacteroidales bacterium]